MKMLMVLTTLIAMSSAHASYMATHCSNSDASVKWEEGHNSNTLTVKSDEGKDLVIPFYDLKTEFSNEAVLREERIQNCGYMSYKRVYAAKVVITPAEHKPDALDALGETKKIETEVICTRDLNSRSYCP